MNSFNHYAFGAIGEWMYTNILGIQADSTSPGYKHFILKPLPGGTITWAEGSYHSISGEIDVKWKLNGNQFEYRFTIPPNTTATLKIPCKSINHVWCDGKSLSDTVDPENIDYTNGYTISEFQAGSYLLSSELPDRIE